MRLRLRLVHRTRRALAALAAAAGFGAVVAAPYDPPAAVPAAAVADEAAVRTLLPPGARLLHGPVAVPFGAHPRGWFVALRLAEPAGGYALWYLTPQPGDAARARLIRLRDPDPADEFFDVAVRAAFAAGPAGARDLVVLERFSRPAPAGGELHDVGRVYRREGRGARAVAEIEPLLDGAGDAAQALRRLESSYARLLPPASGELARAFSELPPDWVDLTRLERLQRLQRGHPLLQVDDPANGYLELRGDGGDPGYVAALFRRDDGGAVVAVQQRWPDAQRTRFASRQGGRWIDLTEALLPGWRDGDDCTLPQRGRMLSCADGRRWVWNGRGFDPVGR